jgi:hypothetical protein
MNCLLLQRKIVFPELLAGNDHQIVAKDECFNKIPKLWIWMCDIDMASPNPRLNLFIEFDERERLWIVHNYTIMVQVGESRKAVVGF